MGANAVYVKSAGSQSEYAAHRKALGLRGQTQAAVSKAISSGRIKGAVRDDGLIDFVEADRAWAATTTQEYRVETPKPSSTKQESTVVSGDEFLAVKIRREKAEAELAELKAGKARKDLIETAEAVKTWYSIGRMFGAARERIPASIAPNLIGKTDLAEIEQIIKSALRDADARVAEEIKSRFEETVGEDPDPGNDSSSADC